MKKINEKEMRGTCPEGTEGVDFKPLLAKNMSPPNFYLRVFDIAPGGHTPLHKHDWEHETYIAEGSGKIILQGREEKLIKGDAVFVEPNELHQFVNSGKKNLKIICVIPKPKED